MRAVNDPRVDRERSDFVRLENGATSCGLHPYRRYPDATCNMKGPLFENTPLHPLPLNPSRHQVKRRIFEKRSFHIAGSVRVSWVG